MRGLGALLCALIVYTGLAHADLPVFDNDFGCITQAKADQYAADFKIDVQSFGGMELCNSNVDTKKLFDDLELIEDGQFTGNQQNLFIKNFVPRDNYYSWMKGETYGMSRGNDIPYATAYNKGGYFTMQDGWSKLSTLGRVGTITHEARHTEGFRHVECDHGPYQDSGVEGCDDSVQEAGAHAIEMEYYARVAVQGANYHPVYRSMARLMLLARANFVFNEDPMAEHDGLLALTDKGLVRVNDTATSTLTLAAGLPPGTALKRSSFGATLLDLPSDAWAIDLVNANPQAQLDDEYSYFKILKMTPPANLRDIEEFDIGTRRYIFAANNQGQIYSYVFVQGAWSQPASVPGFQEFRTVAPDGTQGIFAKLTNGSYCALDVDSLTCAGAAKPWPSGAKNFVKFKNEVLTLGQDGSVVGADKNALPELQGLNVHDLVSVPQYNVFE